MSASQYYALNLTLVDTRDLLTLLCQPGMLPETDEGRFIIAAAERLAPQVAQSRKDIHQRLLRHAIIDTPDPEAEDPYD